MENEKTFKTKTGFCHVLPEKLVLTRDGVVGNVSKIVVGNGITKTLIFYLGISIFLFYNAYTSFQIGKNSIALLYGLVSFFLFYNVIKSINNSASPVIERAKIKEAKFIDGKTGLTRARFEIMFEDENGKLKKRLIMLPGSLTNGENETEKALRIMRSEKIITS